MLINAVDPEESRIATVKDGVLQELHVEIASREAYLGNIYKGRVANIEPSIGAAFVSFGGTTNGFLHASDVLPDYSRDDFALTDVLEGRARATGDDGPDVVRAVLEDADEEDEDDGRGKRSKSGKATAGEGARVGDAAEEAEGEGSTADRRRGESRAHGDEDLDDDLGDEDLSDGDLGEEDDEDEGGGRLDEQDDHVLEVHGELAEEDDDHAEAGEDDGEPIDAPPAEAGGDADSGPEDAGEAPETQAAPAATAVAAGRSRGRGRRGGAAEKRERRPRLPIDRLLRKGQEVIVQITKEGIGNKGPTLTTYVSLPGRCLVLMPSLPKCGVSRKIEGHKERRRLKRIVRELDTTGNGGIGFIVRTAGTGKSKEDLERDRDYLARIWEFVGQRARVTRAPAVLYQESDLVLKAMRDLFTPDIDEVVVDSKDVHMRIKEFADKLMPHMSGRIRLHEGHTPLFHSFGIEPEVEKLYQPRVEIGNGAYIIVEQTEALVSIDVNSGKFKPGTDLEETAYRTNLQAIPEIVRQLRLRDLGGLIIIDFIDMNSEKHRRGIERKLVDGLKGDRARIKVGRISRFGLMELTRQRVGPGLKRTVFTHCGHCNATGLVRTVQSKALAVLRDVRALVSLKGFSILHVYVASAVNDYLVNYKRRPILDLEEAVGKKVVFRAEPSYPVDAVHYRFLTADRQEAKVAVPAGLGVRV
ncbi:MAG: Rne/Rng family ribonuclease [Planctomycetota bacterium]